MFSQNGIVEAINGQIFDNQILSSLRDNRSVSVKGLPGSLKILFSAWLLNRGPGIIVLPDEATAESVAEEAMAFIGDDRVAFYPYTENRSIPVSLNPRMAGMKMEVLRDLFSRKLEMVITVPQALIQSLPAPDEIQKTEIVLRPGIQKDLTVLSAHLTGYGYVRESLVERPGEICVRGGILDIFPYTGEHPHRIEFNGNSIESMRLFDIETQCSIGESGELVLVASPDTWNSSENFLPDYFHTKPWILFEDQNIVLDHVKRNFADSEQEHLQKFLTYLQSFQLISHDTLSSEKESVHLDALSLPPLGRTPSSIRQQIEGWLHSNQVCLICDTSLQIDRMMDFLDLDNRPLSGFQLITGSLYSGFRLPSLSWIVLTQDDILGHPRRRHRQKRFYAGSKPIREISALNRGDYVVHIDHGIGTYQGLQKITVADTERECLSIRYKDEDMLYVPVDKIERVQKYAGRESIPPELSKLGSSQWDKIKTQTKKSVEKIARELITLYSVRLSQPGFAFAEDTLWQKELEASFAYDETADQIQSIRDVKKDMEKPVPMDRLICGDVGYGKTEVAIRAAFKAVSNGKQVAVLVPTTILAQQHFQTFLNRLASFPIEIEMLSRFRDRPEQSEITKRLKQGTVDIVIGTHRLLSKDVGFKNLGLLIIDEEQKFGVRHKERLKEFKHTVDVLALSATPIPRSLNLSLIGVRDMSVINTPPRDRLPIHTEVLPFNEAVVAEAIHHELNRQGQVFFVHNRIQSIHAVARMIERIVPDVRLAIAHGKMNEHELEKVMVDFVQQKYNCLVATMIVGSGLDMPHVNTLLVNRADRLGLSQLYQLRGRVGRSNQKAYAYLFTPPLDLLTQDAIKRLRTIEEFTELGAGFQIAMKDLEIRGAGNLLGYQQSGFVDAVGFELYTKLVSETVDELKRSQTTLSEKKPAASNCQAHIHEDAYIPDTYIEDENLRIGLYKRLSGIQSESSLNAFKEELKDRFGEIPDTVHNLISLFHIQMIGNEKCIRQIRIENRKVRLFFDESLSDRFDSPEAMSQFLKKISELSGAPVRFLTQHGLGVEVSVEKKSGLDFTKKWLQSWG